MRRTAHILLLALLVALPLLASCTCGSKEEVTPAPAMPEEVTPAPTMPEEVTPAPTMPEEVTPAPTMPEEVTPAPTTPGKVTPVPSTPEEITPTPIKPDTEFPETIQFAVEVSDPKMMGSWFIKSWMKGGEKARFEFRGRAPGGEEEEIIFINNGYQQYRYHPETQTATEPTMEESSHVFWLGFSLQPLFVMFAGATEQEILAAKDFWGDENVKVVGHEKVCGLECAVFEVGAGGSKDRSWIATDTGYMLKMEAREGDKLVGKMEFKELDLNPKIADSMFELPPGTKIE